MGNVQFEGIIQSLNSIVMLDKENGKQPASTRISRKETLPSLDCIMGLTRTCRGMFAMFAQLAVLVDH